MATTLSQLDLPSSLTPLAFAWQRQHLELA
jgi:hypothetical protein